MRDWKEAAQDDDWYDALQTARERWGLDARAGDTHGSDDVIRRRWLERIGEVVSDVPEVKEGYDAHILPILHDVERLEGYSDEWFALLDIIGNLMIAYDKAAMATR